MTSLKERETYGNRNSHKSLNTPSQSENIPNLIIPKNILDLHSVSTSLHLFLLTICTLSSVAKVRQIKYSVDNSGFGAVMWGKKTKNNVEPISVRN